MYLSLYMCRACVCVCNMFRQASGISFCCDESEFQMSHPEKGLANYGFEFEQS